MNKTIWLFLTASIVLLVVWTQGKPLFDNGLVENGRGLVFRDVVILRDSLVHLSLINEIGNRFPPTNFSAGGIPLKNYHYLFDTLLALLAKLTPINTLDLYFRIMPVIVSLLLCLVIYKTVFKLTKNRFYATLGIFFTVFATSFGSILPQIKIFFSARSVTGGNNNFMTDQIFNMLINPQGVLSLIIFLTLFLLLEKYSREKKILPLIFYGLLLGVSFGIKAYGGIVFAAGGTIFSFYYLLIKRDPRPLLATFVGIFIMAVWFLYTIDNKVAGIKFAPFWLLDVMFTDNDRFNEPSLTFLKSTYIYLGSWHHVARLTIEQFIVYFVGSIGLRLLGFVGIFYLLKKQIKQSPSLVFLLVGAAVSFIIPLFFNQSSKAYDIIQFTPYFTLFMGLMFTFSLFLIGTWQKKLAIVLIIVSILLFLKLDEKEIIERTHKNRDEIIFSESQIKAIEFIKSETPPNSIFLLPVNEFNDDYLWLPGLAGRRTFYSGERFAAQVGVDVNGKKKEIEKFQAGKGCALKYDYIYLDKSKPGNFDRISKRCKNKVVFENDEVVISHHN